MSAKHLKLFFTGLLMIMVFFSCLLFLSPASASTKSDIESQMDTAGMIGWGTLADSNTMPKIVQYVISSFLGLLGIIFIVLIIYAGYNWMTARGDEQKVTMAKESLSRAVIGLIIIVAAYSITYFVFSSLPDGSGGNVGGSP